MTPEEACKLLNDLTDTWTLDYAPAAFILYFKDKRWLLSHILDANYETPSSKWLEKTLSKNNDVPRD